jgi:putative phosphoribosyl transferase
MNVPIHDRLTAGRELAQGLLKYRKQPNVIVLGLPRGGVPVAAEIARALHAPLDIMVVRKLGTPGQEELAMGAIGSGGVRVLNEDIISSLGIAKPAIDAVAAREAVELDRRMTAYRGQRPWPDLEGKRVILVDDGIATGATMRAASAWIACESAARRMPELRTRLSPC